MVEHQAREAIIYPILTIAFVAKFAFDVLEISYAVPVFRLNASEAANVPALRLFMFFLVYCGGPKDSCPGMTV
jgi:hypothetical protein